MKNKKKFILLTYITMILFFGTFCLADAGQEEDAKLYVNKVVQYINKNGLEKAKKELIKPDGQFQKNDLLINISDFNGVLLAHNTYIKLIGENHWNLKDPKGKLFIQQSIEIAKKGGGWSDFWWTNPKTKKIQSAHGWIQRVPDMEVWVMATIPKEK